MLVISQVSKLPIPNCFKSICNKLIEDLNCVEVDDVLGYDALTCSAGKSL